MTLANHPERARAYVVGLTGGIGSGKSAAATCFAELGAAVVDTDAIAHALCGPGGAAMAAIESSFGSEVINPDGSLNRPRMRALAFGDEQIRHRLESILHPLIRDESRRQLRAVEAPYAVLVVPLLIETGVYRSECDRVLVIDCEEDLQIRRVMARSGLTRSDVQRIIATQVERTRRVAAADDVIDNSGELAQLRRHVATLHGVYLDAAKAVRG